MKRFISLICITFFVIFSTEAFAYTAVSECDYTFAGERYSISQIDTDGKVFAGVLENKLAVSEDFQEWTVLKNLDDVFAVEYLENKFCGINKGYTLISHDGKTWEKRENNLPAPPQSIIKNGSTVVVFAENNMGFGERTDTGTYQSYDGVNWKKVENIPEGARMSIINGKIFFASSTYMQGIYVSDTGESFEKIDIPGFEISNGGMFLEYRNGEYVQWDSTKYDESDNTKGVYFSKDLKNWEYKRMPCPDTQPHDSTYVNINGQDHQLTINGDDYVWTGEEWQSGEYYMSSKDREMNPPFTYYNITDYGILAWNTDHCAYYINNDGEMTVYDGKNRRMSGIISDDGVFYAVNSYNEDGTKTANWKSADGMTWESCTKIFAADFEDKYCSASNGTVTIKSNIDIRGSWRNYEGNAELTGTITDADGKVSKIAFEDTKGIDYVRIFGGDGWFIVNGDNGKWYFSKDGITRGESIDFPEQFTYLYSNGKNFLYRTQNGINHVGSMEQFAELYAPETVRVKLNDEFLSFSAAPVVINGRTLVPVRFLFERMGANVTWHESAKAVTITYGDTTVDLAVGGDVISVNGEAKKTDCAPQLINGKTMFPMRFIAEELGFTVNYDEANKIAEIRS